MTEPTTVLSLSRPSGGPLIASGTRDPDVDFGIVRYFPPDLTARIGYAPDSGGIDGSEATSASWQQAMLGFEWIPLRVASEADIQVARALMVATISQFRYTVTSTVNGAPPEIWTADRGSMSLSGSDGRTYVDLKYRVPVYSVTIPVYPVPA